MDRQLQTVSNYFLLSLSVADFAIGLVSMPLYTVYLLMNRWPLGPVVCDAWLSVDYTMSNASVANLLRYQYSLNNTSESVEFLSGPLLINRITSVANLLVIKSSVRVSVGERHWSSCIVF